MNLRVCRMMVVRVASEKGIVLGIDRVGGGRDMVEGVVSTIMFLPMVRHSPVGIHRIGHQRERNGSDGRVLSKMVVPSRGEGSSLQHEARVGGGKGWLVRWRLWILLLDLTVDEKIVEDPAWTPDQTVSPSFDAGLDLVENEDRPAPDELALVVTKTTGDLRQDATPYRLKDEQSISCRVSVQTCS